VFSFFTLHIKMARLEPDGPVSGLLGHRQALQAKTLAVPFVPILRADIETGHFTDIRPDLFQADDTDRLVMINRQDQLAGRRSERSGRCLLLCMFEETSLGFYELLLVRPINSLILRDNR
jgi:hypothetical protein